MDTNDALQKELKELREFKDRVYHSFSKEWVEDELFCNEELYRAECGGNEVQEMESHNAT